MLMMTVRTSISHVMRRARSTPATGAPRGALSDSAGETTRASVLAADVPRELEDREVHRDDETADDDAEERHHDRLDQGRHGGDRGVDLVLVEVGDLLQHLVHRAGLLADADHLHDHAGEDLGLAERAG